MKLDRNGYAPSIIQPKQDYPHCFLCGGLAQKLDRHEAFPGSGRREKCKRMGLWVNLCHDECHIFGAKAVHQSKESALALQRVAEARCREVYGMTKEQFIAEFNKSYLED